MRVTSPSPISATRAALIDNLVNLDASLAELFYEHFATMLDDDPDVVTGGTVTAPEALIDNNTGVGPIWDTVNEYADITFEAAAYIKQIRVHGWVAGDGSARAKLQAYVDGAWEDALLAIEGISGGGWSAWLDLTTPRTALRWRFTLTTDDVAGVSEYDEIELKGVKIG